MKIPPQSNKPPGSEFKNFYCSGNPHGEFKIDEFNKQFEQAIDLGIEDDVILPGRFNCLSQCDRCLNEVLDRKLKKRSKDMGAIEYGNCDICGNEAHLSRKYWRYTNLKCDCHSPLHFDLVRHCSNCEPEEPFMHQKWEQIQKQNEELKYRVTQLQDRNEYMTEELEDVVSELDLSESMLEKHGPLGTKPSILVNLILSEKDLIINSLKYGLKEIKERSKEK